MVIVTYDKRPALLLVGFSIEELRCIVLEAGKLDMSIEQLLMVVIRQGRERVGSVSESGKENPP